MDEENWCMFTANQVTIPDIAPIYNQTLQQYFKIFAYKEFMLHQVEGLSLHPVWNKCKEEHQKFLKTLRELPVDKIPKDSNIITLHMIYK